MPVSISNPPAAAGPDAAAVPHADRWVHRHATGVWRFLRTLGAAPELAEEICQEAFLVAWTKGVQQLEPAALGAFLRRTARHLWLRRRAADHRARRALAEFAALGEVAERAWQRDCRDDGEGLIAAARTCVARLQGRARAAVELIYRDGCGRAEAAAKLGMKANGLKTLLQRARQWLKECMQRARLEERR